MIWNRTEGFATFSEKGEAKLRRTPSISAWSFYAALVLMVVGAMAGCGGGSSGGKQSNPQAAGNWQFMLATPGDGSFHGDPNGAAKNSVIQGGFLLQSNGNLTGQAAFSIWVPGKTTGPCNSGTASIAGKVSGQSVSLAATVGTLDSSGNPTTQTFTLSGGTLSGDNSTITGGTYTSTAGYYIDVNSAIASCGTAQSSLAWSSAAVPAITGGFQGFFHSTSSNIANPDYPLTGSFTQGPNTGAASTTVTGTLVFKDPATGLNDYPCFGTASVTGTISGSAVVLQIYGSSGLPIGQIGGINNGPNSAPVTFSSPQSGLGYVLRSQPGSGAKGPLGYTVSAKSCPGGSDSGSLCFAFGNTSACTQPLAFSPVTLTSAPQLVGSVPTTQTVTVTNTTASQLSGISLNLSQTPSQFYGGLNQAGDFSGLPNFTVVATGGASDCTTLAPLGSKFDLTSSCTVTVQFTPQQSCSWLPSPALGDGSGVSPVKCPGLFNQFLSYGSSLKASLVATAPSLDGDTNFAVPMGGTGFSALAPSTPELDFGALDAGETSDAQVLTFTNQGTYPVQILPMATTTDTSTSCKNGSGMPQLVTLPRPIMAGNTGLDGIRVVYGSPGNILPLPIQVDSNDNTVQYYCDTDDPTHKGSGLPNFQVARASGSTYPYCPGQLLQPGASCSLQVTYQLQPFSSTFTVGNGNGLDYFLQLNTLQCGSANPTPGPSNPCEVDAGRFPVELKTNASSPLRMSPSAGLAYGTILKGTIGTQLTLTLSNDSADGTDVTFSGKLLTGADYLESDSCPSTLNSGQQCTLTFTYTPTVSGFDPGSFVVTYNTSGGKFGSQFGLQQFINLRATGQ